MPATDPGSRTRSAARDAAVAAFRQAVADVQTQRAATRLRELRIDLDRRAAVLQRALEALDEALVRDDLPQVVVAARDDAAVGRLLRALTAGEVLGPAEGATNGADALGLALAAQPVLVVVDSPLPMVSALDVVADVRRWAPGTVVVACADGAGPAELRAAGADAVFRRGAPPADVAREAAAVLAGRDQVPQPRG